MLAVICRLWLERNQRLFEDCYEVGEQNSESMLEGSYVLISARIFCIFFFFFILIFSFYKLSRYFVKFLSF